METPIKMGWFGGKTHYFWKRPNGTHSGEGDQTRQQGPISVDEIWASWLACWSMQTMLTASSKPVAFLSSNVISRSLIFCAFPKSKTSCRPFNLLRMNESVCGVVEKGGALLPRYALRFRGTDTLSAFATSQNPAKPATAQTRKKGFQVPKKKLNNYLVFLTTMV